MFPGRRWLRPLVSHTLSALCCAPLLAAAAAPAAPAFPPTPAGDTVDTYFGTRVADPYRWLEDVKAPQTVQWMKAASDHAAATLASIPGREALLARLKELDAGASITVGRVLRTVGGMYVYESRKAGENQYSIRLRQGLQGAERTLVDTAVLARDRGGVTLSVNYFSVSPNGRYLAYGVSERGAEDATLYLMDTATGKVQGEPIPRAQFGVARWAPDSLHFATNILRPPGPDRATKYDNSAVWLVPVEGGWTKAREILGPNSKSIQLKPVESPDVRFTADGQWLLGFIEDGVRRDIRLLVAPASSLSRGEPAWSERITASDRAVDAAYANGQLYATTYADAPRYRIITAPVTNFSAATARTVVSASDRVIGTMVEARDGLYFEARNGNAKELWRLPYGPQAAAQAVPLPLQGSFSLRQSGGGWAAVPTMDGVVIGLQDWTHDNQYFEVAADGSVRNTGLQPPHAFGTPTDLQTTEVLVTSHDGARVPLSVIHKKGLALEGRNPTLLQGYGAYGFTWEARFDASRLAWLEKGGVIAIANPRGSGVFGHDWYLAGKEATKPNTWRDMIACGEYLVAQGYASPATLAIEGGSAGGITSGRAATERPDLFAAVVPRVGVLDAVRIELEANGPPNIPEFGTHKTEAGFRALLAMSTYHHIQPGVRYPAVLLMHGVNDPRVDVWQSSKTAARFAAASANVKDGRPVLLRLDYEAGHGVGSTRLQRQQETADLYAFLFWQLKPAEARP